MLTPHLIRLMQRIQEHWSASAPDHYQAMKRAGTLESAARMTATRILETVNSWIASGLTSQQAWEKVYASNLWLPPTPLTANRSDLMDIVTDLMSIHREFEREAD